MHTRKIGWMAAVAVLVGAASAQADETPRNWVLEVQLGGYQPRIDRGVEGTPFADVFEDKDRLLTLLSVERLIFKDFGSLGLGVQSGYVEFFGRGFVEGSNETSGDRTSLHVVPLNAFLAYRFDYAALKWDVPLALYGKAGLGFWFWWANDGDGNTAGGGNASGTKSGVVLSAGLAVHLDWFDPKLANEFDRNFGVNNTYLFVDYTNWNAKFRGNFLKHGVEAQGIDLSDQIWSGGIAFEF